jgi:hypothetical protein
VVEHEPDGFYYYAMWLRFLGSGWYEILVGTLLFFALALAFYVYGPQFGTGVDSLIAWIGGLSIEGRVLSVFFIGLGIIWLGVASMDTLLRIER